MTLAQKMQSRLTELETRLAKAEGRIAELEREKPNHVGPRYPVQPNWPEPHPFDTHPVPCWPNYPKPTLIDDLEITCETAPQPKFS